MGATLVAFKFCANTTFIKITFALTFRNLILRFTCAIDLAVRAGKLFCFRSFVEVSQAVLDRVNNLVFYAHMSLAIAHLLYFNNGYLPSLSVIGGSNLCSLAGSRA